MTESYSPPLNGGIIEVRFNNLQFLQIDEALGRVEGTSMVKNSWYRLSFDHSTELGGGRSVILTFPARLGALPADFYGIKPDARAEWLPVIIRALQVSKVSYRLAEVLTAVYEAIVWDYAAELAEFDGLFDLATIAGCQRLLARRESMEHMHHLTPAISSTPVETLAFIESGEVARFDN